MQSRFGGFSSEGVSGQFGVGLLLGAVWTPCRPHPWRGHGYGLPARKPRHGRSDHVPVRDHRQVREKILCDALSSATGLEAQDCGLFCEVRHVAIGPWPSPGCDEVIAKGKSNLIFPQLDMQLSRSTRAPLNRGLPAPPTRILETSKAPSLHGSDNPLGMGPP